MMGKALADIFIDDEGNPLRQTFDILGRPLVALLIAVVVGIFTLGRGAAMTRIRSSNALRRRCPRSPVSS
jgi:GntP family gluconate:H+ symporter